MIVITTPTGNIGRQVLARVVASGQSVRVIARRPAQIPEEIRNKIEVVEGSHGEAGVVQKAFSGAHTVFWLPPPNPQAESPEAAYIDFTKPAYDALRSQGVRRVVGISALGRGTPMANRAGLVTASLAMDDLIMRTGVSYRALTMPSFMDNVLRQKELIKTQGLLTSPLDADRRLPTCAVRDIAFVAADLLLDPVWSGQGAVPVLGPEDLSFNEMAQIISEVLGKTVRYQQVPIEAFKARLLENGMSEAFAQGYVDMMLAKNEGLDNAEPRTLRNTTPTTFRRWCEEVLKPAAVG